MDNIDDNRSEIRLADEVAVFIETKSSPNDSDTVSISVSKTIDISANGLQITADIALPQNSLLQLCIQISDRRFYLTGEVMWSRPTENEYAIGFQLIESEHTEIDSWKAYICERLNSL